MNKMALHHKDAETSKESRWLVNSGKFVSYGTTRTSPVSRASTTYNVGKSVPASANGTSYDGRQLLYRTAWTSSVSSAKFTNNVYQSVFAGTDRTADNGRNGAGKYSITDAFSPATYKYTCDTISASEPE